MRSLISGIFVSLFALSLTGCGLFNQEIEAPSHEGYDPPPITTSDEDSRIDYDPHPQTSKTDPSPSVDMGTIPNRVEPSLRCQVHDFEYEVDPESVNAKAIDFIYTTQTFEKTVDTGDLFEDAEHVHLIGIILWVKSGSDLSFIDWMVIQVGDQDLAWANEIGSSEEFDMQVDGRIDLMTFITPKGEITLQSRVRARSPQEDTLMGATILLRKFYDCVEGS